MSAVTSKSFPNAPGYGVPEPVLPRPEPAQRRRASGHGERGTEIDECQRTMKIMGGAGSAPVSATLIKTATHSAMPMA